MVSSFCPQFIMQIIIFHEIPPVVFSILLLKRLRGNNHTVWHLPGLYLLESSPLRDVQVSEKEGVTNVFEPLELGSFCQGEATCFFFFPFIFISWRLITLQYCSGFCHILIWISHGFTCIPHPDPPSHLPLYLIPLGLPSAPGKHLSYGTLPRALVLCIQPGLVLCFTLDNMHVSMLFSWNIPPSPSPTESKSLFCTSVSLFLFCI